MTKQEAVPNANLSYLCDSHAETVGEEQDGVPFKQRANYRRSGESDEEERRAALLNMQRAREREKREMGWWRWEEGGGDRQVSVSG